jgi:hypothetical protein
MGSRSDRGGLAADRYLASAIGDGVPRTDANALYAAPLLILPGADLQVAQNQARVITGGRARP